MKKFMISFCVLWAALCVSFSFSGCFKDSSNTVGKIGDTLTNSDGVDFNLVSCENTQQLGNGTFVDATTNNFVLLTLKVTNNSNESHTFSNSCADLYNSNNSKYETITSLYIDYILSADVGVGISKTFQVAFETPTTTTQDKYTVKIGYNRYTSNNKRVVFDLSQINDNSENETTNNLSQYFVDECPIGLSETSTGVGSSNLELYFQNISDKKIIAYETVFILYNVYSEPLIYLGNTTKYNKLSYTPTNFTTGSGDWHSCSINSQVYYAEVYIYYVLFEDTTSWGYRLESGNKVTELGTMYKVERYSY